MTNDETLLRLRRALPVLLSVFVVCLLLGTWSFPAWADENEPDEGDGSEESEPDEDEELRKLPTIDKIEVPGFQDLRKGPAVDWIVLHSKRVIVVEPVLPRPGTLESIDQAAKKLLRKPGDPPETEEAKRRRLAKSYLPITLVEGEEREWKIHIRFVKEIVYFEDLMLRRIDQLLDERKVRQGYDLLDALVERAPAWAGIAARKDRLLATEADVQLADGQPEHALALLEALHERNSKYQGLDEQFGAVGERLVERSLAAHEPRAARYFLRRIARRYPNHKFVKETTAQLTQQTRDLVSQAVAAERSDQISQALDLAEQAARTWPDLADLLPIYNRLAARLPRLRVGVIDLPAPGAPSPALLLSAADRRHRQLTETPLFEPARLESKIVRYETAFFREWEPTELGHSVLFRLRPRRAGWESRPLVTAAGLAEALAHRIDSADARYDARFAAVVESLAVRSPFELTVRFRQVPLRPEALFAFACSPADGSAAKLSKNASGSGATGIAANTGRSPASRIRQVAFEQEVGSTEAGSAEAPGADDTGGAAPGAESFPFELASVDERSAIYRRSVPEQASAERHVGEIIEIRFDDSEKAIQALLRDEVSCLTHVSPWRIRALEGKKDFFTQRYALPTTHVLQFNPHSRPLTARTLRRALVYALDRPRILTEVFLHEPPGKLGRSTSAPFATRSYAYDPQVAPHKFDPALAYSLAKSAEKELGDKPPVLRLVCPADPDIQAAAARIVAQWKAVGIESQLVPASNVDLAAPEFGQWDVIYRAGALAEPLVDLWEFLALTSSTETGALAHLPMWLRQELLKLDRVGDWPTAERLLRHVHKQFWAEAYLIPLWEIDDVLVYRKNVRGVPERPVAPYQKIERWRVEPWYSREQPS